MRLASHIIRRLRAEHGSAMVVAMGAMSVILLLSAWAADSSVQLSGNSKRDLSSKRALPAAEAGLRDATYKLNNRAPAGTACPAGFTAQGTTLCTNGENAGNGTRYDYWMTKAITSGTCAGFTVTPDPNLEVRCVTVRATANGETRRAQARLVRSTGLPLFPFPGIFGDQLVQLKNNSTVRGALGSNVRVELENHACIRDGIELGTPGGTVGPRTPAGGAGCDSSIVRHTAAEGPFVLNPKEFGNSNTVNNNAALAPLNGSAGSLNSFREMQITGSNYSFPEGVYNFCSLYIEGGTITISGTVTIYIDSRSRDSTCRTNTGTLIGNNNVVFQNPGDATNLQIYVYGAGPVEFKNNLTMNGFLHAPQATVIFKNNTSITGGVAAKIVESHNNLDFYTSASGQLPRGTTVPIFYRTAWRECTPSATSPTDDTSGC